MLLKEKLKNNTVLFNGYYINENSIDGKFIKIKMPGGATCYRKGSVDLIINDEVEKEEVCPNYTTIIEYWDESSQSIQFDGLKTVYDINIAILEVKQLHKSSYWSHELIMH